MITIVLLTCFTSWCQNDTIPFTGELDEDTIVCLPIGTIKVANSKMIELEYEKEINECLNEVVSNDSVIISTLNNNIDVLEKQILTNNKKSKQYKTQRDVAIGTTSGVGVTCIVLILLLCLL